jgi:hypothetical protein
MQLRYGLLRNLKYAVRISFRCIRRLLHWLSYTWREQYPDDHDFKIYR